MTKHLIMICLTLGLWSGTISAQSVITGTVTDRKGKPVPGALVKSMYGNETTLTNLDGTFMLECEARPKKLEVKYVGYQPKSMKAIPGMEVKLRRTNAWNRMPQKSSWFLSLQTSYRGDAFGTQSTPSVGLMFGQVRRHGWYIKLLCQTSTFSPDMKASDYVYSAGDKNWQVNDRNAWMTTGRAKMNTTSFSAGWICRLGCALHFYLGGGLAYLQDHHEIAGGKWVGADPYSFLREPEYLEDRIFDDNVVVVADLGFILRLDRIFINAGGLINVFSSLEGPYVNPAVTAPSLNLGIGIVL